MKLLAPFFLILFLAMTANPIVAQDGKATTVKKTFSRETSVKTTISAPPAAIWALLTDASGYTRWNSTITSLEGSIAEGEKIRLKSTLDEKRTFKLKVKELVPNDRLVWGDGQGTRVYQLTANPDGTTGFSMTEKIGGFMFPMYAGMIPSFDESFEQFAADLKRAAEGK